MNDELVVIDEGTADARYRVRETETHYIEVLPMLVNWRIHTIRKDDWLGDRAWSERYWCYQGRGEQSFLNAIAAAKVWDGADDTEPAGFFKSWDGRYTNPGLNQRGLDGALRWDP